MSRTEGPKVEVVYQVCKMEIRTIGGSGEEMRRNEVYEEAREVSRCYARIVGHSRGIGLNPKSRKFLNILSRRVV